MENVYRESATALLDMCSASPLLTKLTASGPALSHLWSNVDEFATMISSACPLLESVNFPTLGGLSKAESYQMHFPKTKCVSLARGGGYVPDPYEPTRWDKIEASARNCEHALELNLHTSANVLRLALGCPKLVDLVWYASLTPLADGNGENVDALEELLESRAKQSSKTTYVEIEVFEEFGPWKTGNWRHRPEHAYYHGPQ